MVRVRLAAIVVGILGGLAYAVRDDEATEQLGSPPAMVLSNVPFHEIAASRSPLPRGARSGGAGPTQSTQR